MPGRRNQVRAQVSADQLVNRPLPGLIGVPRRRVGQRDGVAQAMEAATRADVDADEVLLLVGFLWRLDNGGWEKRAAHLDLVMDGLRS